MRQLNEFETAAFPDKAKYVRITTFTGQYIRSDIANITQTLALTPRAYFRNPTNKWLQTLNRFSTQSSVQINRKTLASPQVQAWNPYQINIADNSLVSTTSILRNSLFFNKIAAEYGAEYTLQDVFNKQILTNGADSRRRTEHLLRLRYAPIPALTVTADATVGTKQNNSDLFRERDYRISFQTLAPKLTYTYQQKARLSASYEYANNRNIIGSLEHSLSRTLAAEATYTTSGKSALNAKFSFIDMDFVGDANTAIGFALLEGLQNGKNYLWSLTWDRRLTKTLQLSLTYNGRKTGDDAPVVHIGTMQLRATF